jgi:prepilin-type N-terminal cleavage/methylation domain-containing protein/prepilin-type processing-associated H-X9-DG protein
MNQNAPKNHETQTARGFTLVELLMTITIIITLAALIFVGVKRMRSSADKAVATRNISQLHVANAGYAADHNGRYMPVYGFDEKANFGGNWFTNQAFISYLNGDGNVIKSSKGENTVPLSLLDPAAVREKRAGFETFEGSFGYNFEGMDGPGRGWAIPGSQQSFFVHEIASPERSAAFITCTDWIAHYKGRFLWKDAKAVEGRSNDGKMAFRHGGKALVVYYDGHVGEITPADVRKIDNSGTPKGVANIFWNADGK